VSGACWPRLQNLVRAASLNFDLITNQPDTGIIYKESHMSEILPENSVAPSPQDPAELGLAAYKAGKPDSDNPYPLESREHTDWQTGWEMAMMCYASGNQA